MIDFEVKIKIFSEKRAKEPVGISTEKGLIIFFVNVQKNNLGNKQLPFMINRHSKLKWHTVVSINMTPKRQYQINN